MRSDRPEDQQPHRRYPLPSPSASPAATLRDGRDRHGPADASGDAKDEQPLSAQETYVTTTTLSPAASGPAAARATAPWRRPRADRCRSRPERHRGLTKPAPASGAGGLSATLSSIRQRRLATGVDRRETAIVEVQIVAKTTTTLRPEPQVEPDPVAEFDAARALMAEHTKNLTDQEREELAEHWANEVEARIRARIERGVPT